MCVLVSVSPFLLTLKKLSRDPFSMYSVTIMTGLPETEGETSISHCFTCIAHKLGMTSVCYATEAPAKQQTLIVQHHIDFGFIF